MTQTKRFLIIVLALTAVLVSACGAATAAPGASKVEASPVEFTGVIESMVDSQWVVNGQTITVDPSVIRDGGFKVGDTVKVEGIVNSDGTVTATRVELPDAQDNSNDLNANDANINDANSNDANVNDANSNDDNSNELNDNDDNGNDDNSNDANINDDNGNDDNSNDDNSNDDDSKDDKGGSGGGGSDDGGSGGSGGDDDDDSGGGNSNGD